MLAPKALNLDNDSERTEDGSLPEVSEDDIPLPERLNLPRISGQNTAGKQQTRSSFQKKGGFVIPRKKKQANELLQPSSFDTREGKELLRNVAQSYRDPVAGATLKFEKLELVFNDQLSREYQDKKQSMRNEWRNPKELEDKYAFLYTVDREEARKICENGLEVGSTSLTCLGDPSMGVYLSRHADVISRKPLVQGALGYLLIFKVIKGKVKPVTERNATTASDLLEPTPNFDCHVSRSLQNLQANSPLNQVFDYSQYYFYEFAEEGDDLHVKRPRHCLPYAVITFSMGDSSGPHQESSIAQEEFPSIDNSGFSLPAKGFARCETRIPDKRQRNSHVVWMGKIVNKDRLLANAQLVCHSTQKIKLPFEIGEKIVMKEKISFQQLRPFLTFPLFHTGPPSLSRVCKATLAGGTSFLHCDLVPIEDDHGKIRKLVKFFQEKNWAGIVKNPDANRVIFLIPTSPITLDLGITTVDSPATLHVLLFVKKQKTGRESLISMTTSGSVTTNDFGEVKTVSQIQKELKRHLSTKVDGKEKLIEARRHSLDSVKPVVALASNSKERQDIPQFVLSDKVTNEQTVKWRREVESWLSRPHPLGGIEGDFQKSTIQSSFAPAHVPNPRAAPNLPFQAVHARSSGNNEEQRLLFGRQDMNFRTSGNMEQHRVFSGQQDISISTANTKKQNVALGKQDEHERHEGNIEKQQVLGEHADVSLQQLRQDDMSKKDKVIPSPALVVRKEEHREDPRLRMRHSVDGEPATSSSSSSYGMPYNAQASLQAQGVKLNSTSVPSTSSITATNQQSKYQVNGEFLNELLVKMKFPVSEELKKNYQVNSEIIGSLLETMKLQKPEKSSPKCQVNTELLKELLDKMKLQKPEESVSTMIDGIRKVFDTVKDQLKSQSMKSQSQDSVTGEKTAGLTVSSTIAEKSVKRSHSRVASTEGIGERSQKYQGSALVLSTQSSGEQNLKSIEKRKEEKQTPVERPAKKAIEDSQAKGPKQPQNTPKSSATPTSNKPVKEQAVPELSEAPPPAIPSCDTLTRPQSDSDIPPKKPKLTLILKKRDSREVSAQSSGDEHGQTLEPKLAKQSQGTEQKEKADIQANRKSPDSPVSMDLSPQCTTPSGSVSPITVVSSKGRYHSVGTPASTPSTAPTAIGSSGFPFNPPLPQGPFRSPLSMVPCTSQPNPPSVHSAPFSSPFLSSPIIGTSAPPVIQNPSVSSAPLGGTLPFGSAPPPPGSTFVPYSPISPAPVSSLATAIPPRPAPSGSSFPPPPSHPTIQHREQLWTPPLPPNQRFGFPSNIPHPPGIAPISPAEVARWPANTPHPRPVLPPPCLPPTGGRPHHVFPPSVPFPGPVPEMSAVPRPRVVFPQMPVQRFNVSPLPPTGPGHPHLGGVPAAPQMMPVRHMYSAGPSVPQFPPRQQGPIGFWVAPIKTASASSGGAKGYVNVMPSQSTEQRYSKELIPTITRKDADPQKGETRKENNKHLGFAKVKKDAEERPKENDADGVKMMDKVQKSSTQTGDQPDAVTSKSEMTVVGPSKENREITASERDNKETPTKENVTEIRPTKESMDRVEQRSRETKIVDTKAVETEGEPSESAVKMASTIEAGTQGLEVSGFDKMAVREPNESPSKRSPTHESIYNKNQNVGETEREGYSDISGNLDDVAFAKDDNADDGPKEKSAEAKDPCLTAANESQISASQLSTETSGVLTDRQGDIAFSGSSADVLDSKPSSVLTATLYQTNAEYEESKNYRSEPPENIDKHSDVSISGNSADLLDINHSLCLPTIPYQTEAERKGSKAVSKIYDILRRNAQESRSGKEEVEEEEMEGEVLEEVEGELGEEVEGEIEEEVEGEIEEEVEGEIEEEVEGEMEVEGEIVEEVEGELEVEGVQEEVQEEVEEELEDVNDYNNLDDPDLSVVGDELYVHEEGFTEENKLIFSGEESSPSKRAVHIESGLRVVQLLDLGSFETTTERERRNEESSILNANETAAHAGSSLPSRKKAQETLPKGESEYDDVSDISDEGTPERDLPEYGSVDVELEQRWSSKATRSTDIRASTSVPPQTPEELIKPKLEVVRNEADSSSAITERPKTLKRYVTVPAQKRKRWKSSSEDYDSTELFTLTKRGRKSAGHDRKSRRASPGPHGNGSLRDRQLIDEPYRQSKERVSRVLRPELPPRIVSDFKDGLKITILQDPSKMEKEEEEMEEEEEVDLHETEEAEKKRPLTDMEYSDLEDISPGGLSSDIDSCPTTPDTPETATPAMDFTHPSLGFWAAPLKSNDASKPAGAVVSDEHHVSDLEMLPPTLPPPSYLEEHPLVEVEQSQVPYAFGEEKIQDDVVQEPCISRSSWPVEGFFCQTTTSEERDLGLGGLGSTELVVPRVHKESFSLDDSTGHYISQSALESDEDVARYGQELPQSEVFEYGHGLSDHHHHQHYKSHRGSAQKPPRGTQKEGKYRTTIREKRYPWKSREEVKHSQETSHSQGTSAGGEGSTSVGQSATGRNSGCEEDSLKHCTKRPKVVQDAETDNHGESGGTGKPGKWDIYVFAWMNKVQLENWVRRQNHGAKLATIGTDQTCTVEFTPESIRRSSERLYRRAKKRLRRLCQSSRSFTEDTDALEFDFDDLNAETKCRNVEEAISVSKEDGNVERCTVQSTHIKHSASACTAAEKFAQKHVYVHVDVDCDDSVHPKTDDLLCDKEVSIIFERGLVTKVEEATRNNGDANDPKTNCSLDLKRKDSSTEVEEHGDVLLGDQGNGCGKDGSTRSSVADAKSGSIHKEDVVMESFSTKEFDSSEDKEDQLLHIDMHDIADEVVLHHAASEGNRGAQDGQANLSNFVTADTKNVNEVKSIEDVCKNLNSQHDTSTSDTAQNVLEDDTVTEDVEVNQSVTYEAVVVRSRSVIFEDQKPSIAGQNTTGVENVPFEEGSLGHETPKFSDGDETKEERMLVQPELATDGRGRRGEGDKRASIDSSDPNSSKENHTNEIPAQPLSEEEKAGGLASEKTASTVEPSFGMSSDRLSEADNAPSRAVTAAVAAVSSFSDPAVQRPLPVAVPSPMVAFPQTHFSPFPLPSFPLRPSLHRNVSWPPATLTLPLTTAANTSVYPPAQLQSNYGCDITWVTHTSRVPLQAVYTLPLVASDDLRPTGTDIVSPDNRPPNKDEVSKQPPESIMDPLVNSLLKQFDSESDNFNGSRNTDFREKGVNAKTNSSVCISTPTKLVQESRRKHEEPNDMEIGSDHEGSTTTPMKSAQKSSRKHEEPIDMEIGFDHEGSTTTPMKSAQKSSRKHEEPIDLEIGSDHKGSTTTPMKSAQKSRRKHEEPIDMEIGSDHEGSTTTPMKSAQKSSRKHEEPIDIEIGSDHEGSASTPMESAQMGSRKHKETIDMGKRSDHKGSATIMVFERSESSHKYPIQDKVESAKTVNQQSLTEDVQLHAKDDKALVGKSLDVSAARNPYVDANLLEAQELSNNNTPKETLRISGDDRQETISWNTRDEPGAGKTDIDVDESLPKNSSVTYNKLSGDSPNLIPGNTLVVEGKSVKNPKGNAAGGTQEENLDFAKDEVQVQEGSISAEGTAMKKVTDKKYQENLFVSVDKTRAEKPANLEEDLSEEQPSSPIDPLFIASAEQTIFSSIGGLTNLLGQSTTFDRIAEETIVSTVSSLEDILRQAHSSYLELSNCPSDSGVSVGEEASAPSRLFNFNNITQLSSPPQEEDCRSGLLDGQSLSGLAQSEWLSTNEKSDAGCYIGRVSARPSAQKRSQKPGGNRKFQFFVYSPDVDRECEALKNYMLKAGGTLVNVRNSSYLEENTRELKVFIRRKHLPSVHRLANLYQLKMSPFVKFSLFNTLTDVTEGSRFFENIFVSGGALLADDNFLKTIELDHLNALLRYLKEQSLVHQKFVWVLNISRNGYKKLSLNRPLTRRDSKVLNLLRDYKNEGFVTVLQKGYVTEGIPSSQRYLQTSLKLQIELVSVYRHVILLSDMDKNRMEVPWFFERGIGVMNVKEFLTSFAGEREATNLIPKQPNPESICKESMAVVYCSTPEDETSLQTPLGTPMSDCSVEIPYMEVQAREPPHSTSTPRKRAGRSQSWDAGSMTHTRLQILSCVRTVRDSIRSQISNSTPSSPVGRSM